MEPALPEVWASRNKGSGSAKSPPPVGPEPRSTDSLRRIEMCIPRSLARDPTAVSSTNNIWISQAAVGKEVEQISQSNTLLSFSLHAIPLLTLPSHLLEMLLPPPLRDHTIIPGLLPLSVLLSSGLAVPTIRPLGKHLLRIGPSRGLWISGVNFLYHDLRPQTCQESQLFGERSHFGARGLTGHLWPQPLWQSSPCLCCHMSIP